MPNYRRIISYIYAYENGIKGKNIGFAKLETRNGQCRIQVNVKRIYVGGSDPGVYLLTASGEILLGKMYIRSGAGEFRTTVPSDHIGEQGLSMDQCYGLTIHDEDGWQSYTTIWEDAVSNAAVEVLEGASVESGGRTAAESAGRADAQSAGQVEAESVGRLPAESTGRADAKSDGRAATESFGRMSAEPSERALSASAKAPDPSPVEEMVAKAAIDEKPEPRREPAAEQEGAPEPDGNSLETGSTEDAEPCMQTCTQNPEENPDLIKGNPASRDGREKRLPDEALQILQNLQRLRRESSQGTDGKEENLEEASLRQDMASARAEHEPDSWEEKNPAEYHNSAQTEKTSDAAPPQGAFAQELPPLGSREDLLRLQKLESDAYSHRNLWSRIRKARPKIRPFDYDGGCEVLTINPQDIGLLPMEMWNYGNNSFLLHGYYNYRHLILARLHNPDGTDRYLLGVPGHYFNNERHIASMFGFPNFVLSNSQPYQNERFGYWYTDIRLGN